MKKKSFVLVTSLLFFMFSSQAFSAQAAAKRILCTTFPVFQITRNVTAGVDGIEVELMIPARLGCPHNYSLTPGDMRKIASADILVINGLGMEEFLGAPLYEANPELVTVNSAEGIEGLLEFGHSESGEHPGDDKHMEDQDPDSAPEETAHSHSDLNPHLFASPGMAVKLTVNITEGLAGIYPDGAGTFRENGRRYAAELNNLAEGFTTLAGRLINNRIVTQHGAFDYLARDAGLKIVAVINAEGGSSLSAAGIISLVKKINQTKAGAVFTEPQYPRRIGTAIAGEAGIPAGELDPVASGPENAPLDYYQTVMRRNMEVLENLLGVRE